MPYSLPPRRANAGRLAIPACQHRASREPWVGDPAVRYAGEWFDDWRPQPSSRYSSGHGCLDERAVWSNRLEYRLELRQPAPWRPRNHRREPQVAQEHDPEPAGNGFVVEEVCENGNQHRRVE